MNLTERKAKAKIEGRINNSSLRAGAPMYYYCRSCGLLSDCRGESDFFSPVRNHCRECEEEGLAEN